ncbi:MAG: Fic family protein [Proteobacteria bacterium]|nr:Fic family protein [Pseudomonadota bacterium]
MFEALFESIERHKAALDNCRPLTEGEVARLRDAFLTEYTYNSNAIEGNTLTLRETALVLNGMTIDKKPLKDHLEAVGHRDAYQYIEMISAQKVPMDKRVIKEVHSLVLMDRPMDRGVFRRIPVQIMGAYVVPADPWDIEPKLDALLERNMKEYSAMPVVERISRFHLEFEGIHPFIDGNGRTGRLLMNLDLIQHGYPPIDVKYTDRKEYYDAFDNFYRDDDIGGMISLIGSYLLNRLQMYCNILEMDGANL